jgi:outer membrane biosynthesis protein TonB
MPTPEKLGSTRLVAAVPGALTAVLLVGAVAFGASTLRSTAPAAEPAAPAAPPAVAEDPTPKPRIAIAIDPDHADPKPTAAPAKPKPSATPKPKPSPQEETKKVEQPAATAKPKPAPAPPKATDKPKPAPAPAEPVALALEGWPKDGKVKLAWKPYAYEGFEYYKVVRSTDATVTWPAGAGDTVIGVIGDPKAPWWADKPACGVASSYRVFAVRSGDGGYVTLGASNVVTLTVPCAPDPTPHETKPIGLWAEVRPGEGIKLAWDACAVDGFIAYKVVRSLTNPDPRYPLNDGTELIAAIGDPGQTHLLDAAVTAGEAWTYRVLAVGEGGSGKIVLCQSVAVAATAQ